MPSAARTPRSPPCGITPLPSPAARQPLPQAPPITRAMEGVEITVTAQAPDGKHFVKWVVKAGGVTLANKTSATTTFTMPANDVTIEAEFAETPVESYTLTVIKGTASVAAGTPITDKIEQNTVVTVTADAPRAALITRASTAALQCPTGAASIPFVRTAAGSYGSPAHRIDSASRCPAGRSLSTSKPRH